MKTIGVVINPIAGMGGSVGLKGTDGLFDEALRRGAHPKAHEKMKLALEEIKNMMGEIRVVTPSGAMGGDLARTLGFSTEIVYESAAVTSSADTKYAVQTVSQHGVDLLLFAGGDGTARDVYEALHADIPCIGVPAGVKIHSPVYALNPTRAGTLAGLYLDGKVKRLKEEEVLDIDEAAYRAGKVRTQLYGLLKVPVDQRFMQSRKSGSPQSERSSQLEIASLLIGQMKADTLYIVGPGSTTKPVLEGLGLEKTIIGVDLILNRTLVKSDASEKDILDYLEKRPGHIIVTPTGGQGYLFGRGNQQISARVIRKVGKDNITIIATKNKLAELKGAPLYVDTGDPAVNADLTGHYKVITGHREKTICKVTH